MARDGNRSPPGNHENGNSRRGYREGDSHRGCGRDKTENEARSESTSPANVTSSTRRDMGGSLANSQQMEEVPGVASTERDTGFMTTGQQVEAAPAAAVTSLERSTSPPAWIIESIRRDLDGSARSQQIEEVPGFARASTERDTGFMTFGQQVEGAATAETTSWERSTTRPASTIRSIEHDLGSSANSQQIEEVPGFATASMKRDSGSPTLPAWILESIRRDLTPHTVPAAAIPSAERAMEEQVGINEPQTKKTDAQVSHPEPPAEPARGCGLRRDL